MRGFKRAMMIAVAAIPAMALAADSVTMTAGRWESKTTFVKITIDGVPLPAENFATPDIDYVCITAADAANPQDYFMRSQKGDSCQPSGSVINGKVAISARCDSEEMSGTMAMNGTYSRQSYDIQASTDGVGAGTGKKMVAQARINGRFVGACTGDEI